MRARGAPLAAILATLALVTVLAATAARPIATPDSFSYLGAAQSLATLGALRIPTAEWIDDDSTSALHQFPPGYPTAVALGIRAGATPLGAARTVNALAAAITVGAAVVLAGAADGLAAMIVAPLALLALRGVAIAHLTALSEPLFVAAVLATLALMALRPTAPWRYGLTAALADLVRYAGVSVIVAAGAWAVWQTRRASWRRRVVALLAAVGPGVVAHVLWAQAVRRAGFEALGTTASYTGDVARTLAEGGHTLAEHLAPVPLPWGARAGLAIVVAAGVGALLVAGARRTRVVPAALVLGAAYAAVVLYARAFVGSTIQLDDRIMAPLLAVLACATIAAAAAVLRDASRATRAAVLAPAALWIAAGAWQTVRAGRAALAGRRDYAWTARTHAPIATWLRAAGTGHALFTNDPVAIFFDAGRPARGLPETVAADTMASFDTTLRSMDGALVAYRQPPRFAPTADPTAIAHALGLCRALTAPEGTVWVLSAPGRCIE